MVGLINVSPVRTVAAFLISPLVVAFLAPLAIEGTIMTYPPVLLVGTIPVVYFFTAAVALPLYFSLPGHHKARLSSLLAAAYLVGTVSFAVMSFASRGSYAEVGGTVLVQNGWYTFAGFLNLAKQCLLMGVAASVAGFLFWLIAGRLNRANPSFKRTPDGAA
jgi:hypothetical protein